MSKRILFSPVGGTDPIKYFRDGSMLHICRWYKPDVVYLYLSHEMLSYHRQDNRYVNTILWLGELLGHKFEIHVVEREGLTNVQEYDYFYEDFRNKIIEIERDMDAGDVLLLNMASGTPAMKSALLVLATFAEYKFLPIQVSTPLKKLNEEDTDRKELEIKDVWELNEDNQKDATNRCTEVKCFNLVKLLKIDMIKKHIRAYDYNAAHSIAKEIKDDISTEAYTLIQAADAREKLNYVKVVTLTKDTEFNIFPVKDGDKQKVFEYALVLQIKLMRKEYADFIRGITPLVIDLFEDILKKQCKIKLSDCCTKQKDGGYKWNKKSLEQQGLWDILEAEYKEKGGFKGGMVYSPHLACLIRNKCSDANLSKKIEDMINVEAEGRNMAAHQIVSVTEDWIKSKTGKSVEEIFDIIKYLMVMAGMKANEESWKSYDHMNRLIEQKLDMSDK